jgi:hypothetical protein
LSALAASEVRIVLLYCTQAEASAIMAKAKTLGLLGSNYLWMATQSVVGDITDKRITRKDLPSGMLGNAQRKEIQRQLGYPRGRRCALRG